MKKDFKSSFVQHFIGCCSIAFFLALGTNNARAQCGELFLVNAEGCTVGFTLVAGVTTGWTYHWLVEDQPGSQVFTSTGPQPTFVLPQTASTTWTVTFTAFTNSGSQAYQCQQDFQLAGCGLPTCLTASPRVSCSQLIVDFQTTGPATAQHCWDFGDGNGFCVDANFASHCYVNINTVLTPQVTVTVAIAGGETCSTVVDFSNPNPNTVGEPPIEGIFIGKICEDRNLSQYVGMPLPLPNTNPVNLTLPPTAVNGASYPDVYLAGDLQVDVNYEFNNINLFTGVSTRIKVEGTAQGSPQFGTQRILRFNNGAYVGPQPQVSPQQERCVCLWKGIEVYRNGRLLTGLVNPANRVRIEGALYATRALNFNRLAGHGQTPLMPTIFLSATDLNRNFIGLRGTDGQFFLTLRNNVFDGTDQGLQAFCGACPIANDLDNPGSNANPDYPFLQGHAYAGILVDGDRQGEVNDLGVVAPNGAFLNISNAQDLNTFRNLPVGILVDDANATIRGCRFENIQRYGYANNSGFGVRFIDGAGSRTLNQQGFGGLQTSPWTFRNCEKGIFAGAHSFGTTVSCSQNNMESVQFGIDLNSNNLTNDVGNISTASITNNFINSNLNFGFEAGGYGINVFDIYPLLPSNYTISGNHIIINHPGFQLTTGRPYGIAVEGFANHVDGTNSAIATIYDNGPVDILHGLDGIKLVNVGKSTVSYNNVRLQQPTANVFGAGLRAEHGFGNAFNCNTVTDLGAANNGVVGLNVESAFNSTYRTNTITGTNIGLSVRMNCGMLNDIAFNNYHGPMDMGLSYTASAVTGQQVNKGNQWFGNFGFGAFNDGISSNSQYTASLLNNLTPPLPISTGFFTTQNSTIPTDLICPTIGCCPDGLVDDEVNDLDVLVASGNVTDQQDGSLWSLKTDLYRKLKDFPNLLNGNTSLQGFMANGQGTSLGQLYEVEQDMMGLFQADTLVLAVIEANLAEIAQQQENYNNLAAQLETDPENAGITVQLDSVAAGLGATQSENGAIFAQLRSTIAANADAVLSANNAIFPTGVPDYNQQAVNRLYLEYIGKGLGMPDSNDIALLSSIAAQCPEEGGPAVYRARVLYRHFTGLFAQEDTCGTEERSAKGPNRAEDINRFSVFPNPVSDKLMVRAVGGVPPGTTMSLTNLLGERVFHARLETPSTETQIETGHLPNGVYILTIVNGTETKLTEKIVVLR